MKERFESCRKIYSALFWVYYEPRAAIKYQKMLSEWIDKALILLIQKYHLSKRDTLTLSMTRFCDMNKFETLASSFAVMLHSSHSSCGDTMTLSNARMSDSSSSAFWKTFIFSETSTRRHKRAGWIIEALEHIWSWSLRTLTFPE